jgi:hypothetical protein
MCWPWHLTPSLAERATDPLPWYSHLLKNDAATYHHTYFFFPFFFLFFSFFVSVSLCLSPSLFLFLHHPSVYHKALEYWKSCGISNRNGLTLPEAVVVPGISTWMSKEAPSATDLFSVQAHEDDYFVGDDPKG